jgi:hypothetical protein
MYGVVQTFVQDAIEKAPERGSHQGRITCTISSQGVVEYEPSTSAERGSPPLERQQILLLSNNLSI